MPTAERRLADLIRDEAPLAPARALAVMVALARAAAHASADHRRTPSLSGRLDADDVWVGSDASVSIRRSQDSPQVNEDAASPDSTELGASLGRLLLELLVGRPPLDRSDAFEPAVRDALPASTCSMLARSLSDSPGQWPSVDEWLAELTDAAGGQAPPVPPAERRSNLRRSAMLVAALVVLAAVTIAVLLMAPMWWESVNAEPSPAQVERARS